MPPKASPEDYNLMYTGKLDIMRPDGTFVYSWSFLDQRIKHKMPVYFHPPDPSLGPPARAPDGNTLYEHLTKIIDEGWRYRIAVECGGTPVDRPYFFKHSAEVEKHKPFIIALIRDEDGNVYDGTATQSGPEPKDDSAMVIDP